MRTCRCVRDSLRKVPTIGHIRAVVTSKLGDARQLELSVDYHTCNYTFSHFPSYLSTIAVSIVKRHFDPHPQWNSIMRLAANIRASLIQQTLIDTHRWPQSLSKNADFFLRLSAQNNVLLPISQIYISSFVSGCDLKRTAVQCKMT